jgi:hypothetical protein
MLQVGDQVEFKGRVWTVKDMNTFDNTLRAKAYNESIGIAGFAVLECDTKRRHYESVARIRTNGQVDKFV